MQTQPNGGGHIGALYILYEREAQSDGDTFVQVRRWETLDGNHCELVVEQWRKDEDGELSTEIKVVPFFLSVEEALLLANGRKGQ